MTAIASGGTLKGRIVGAGRLVGANVGLYRALYTNAILFLGLFGIPFLFVATAKFIYGPLPNFVGPGILVILGSIMLVGKRALTITSFDYFFFGFIFLSVTSHIFADEFLYRSLGLGVLQTNVQFILEMAVLFRTFYCLVYISPKLGSKMFFGGCMATFLLVCLLGVTQRFGPGKATAIHIGSGLTLSSYRVFIAATQENRASGVFSNPNILGYVACILAAFALGWGLTELKKLKPWKTVAVILLIGLSFLTVVACQSRQSLIPLVFAPVIFAVGVQLRSLDIRNIVVLGVLFAIAGAGLTIAISESKSNYLTSITKTGLKRDASVKAREGELKKLVAVDGEIAAGGVGQSMSNVSEMLMLSEHSYYNTGEIDSEWGNIFEAFGIWGPVLLAIFYVMTVLDSRYVFRLPDSDAKMIALISFGFLAVNLALTISAVRVSKLESGGFTFMMLGALSAWKVRGLEGFGARGLGEGTTT
jgi:hypothetical protein